MLPKADRIATFIAISAVIPRFALACLTELSPDEAYYLSAARLGLQIPDHPPLTIWLLQLTDHLHGVPVELRTRTFSLIFGTLTSLVLLQCTRRMQQSEISQRWLALLAAWLPLPLAGFVFTPDAPFALCLSLLIWTNLADSRASKIVGVIPAVLLSLAKVAGLPVLAALAIPKRNRLFYLLQAVVAALISLPMIATSLRFQTHHAYGTTHLSAAGSVGAVAAAIGAQVALWTPWVLWFALRAVRQAPRSLVAIMGGFTLLLIGSALLRAVPPEPNWFVPVALPAMLIAAPGLTRASLAVRAATVALGPLLSILAATHTVHPWLPVPARADPTARLHGWKSPVPPVFAPGLGAYALDAERCIYAQDCDNIRLQINNLHDTYKVIR